MRSEADPGNDEQLAKVSFVPTLIGEGTFAEVSAVPTKYTVTVLCNSADSTCYATVLTSNPQSTPMLFKSESKILSAICALSAQFVCYSVQPLVFYCAIILR